MWLVFHVAFFRRSDNDDDDENDSRVNGPSKKGPWCPKLSLSGTRPGTGVAAIALSVDHTQQPSVCAPSFL